MYHDVVKICENPKWCDHVQIVKAGDFCSAPICNNGMQEAQAAAALQRAAQLLGLAQQCLESSASPVLLALAEAHLAKPMSQLSALLASLGSFSGWDAAAKAALTAQLQLCTLMLQRCQVLCRPANSLAQRRHGDLLPHSNDDRTARVVLSALCV